MNKRNAEKTKGKIQAKQTEKITSANARYKECAENFKEFMKEKRNWSFSSPSVNKRGANQALVTLSDANILYNKSQLWNKPRNVTVHSGERIRLIGPNGSGKSTLLKLISGDKHPDVGDILRTRSNIIFIQQAAGEEEMTATLLAFAQEQFIEESESSLRIRLATFGFRGDSVFRTFADLSGGERVRLRLAHIAIAAQTCDILLLDEPSNHLDSVAKDALFELICSYMGALVLVTHDETFATRFEWNDVWSLAE